MRTALFLIALSLYDIAVALGREEPEKSKEAYEKFCIFGLVIFAIMDLIEWLHFLLSK